MTAEYFSPPAPALDANASPNEGATWKFYATGTLTPQAVYADSGLVTSLGATVTADAAGRFADIYFDQTKAYRAILKSADGANTYYDIDPVNTATTADAADITYYGYIGDGSSHALSAVTTFKGQNVTGYTLAQWQALVPEVTSLTNQIDRVAVQAWFNDRSTGGALTLPAGTAMFDAAIKTGASQHVALYGAQRDLTRIKHTGTGWLWEHGWAKGEASGTITLRDFSVIPAANAAASGCFRVRFSGSQRAWCYNISDVLIYPEDGNSYYTQPTETWNIKRGLDWENFIVYGRHFYTQSTTAHWFPPNVGSDCPSGQSQTLAGNSYNFDNCMVVGYYDGWKFDFTGFTSAVAHCHEEARWYACEVYTSVGFASIVDTNTAYAPADNWLFEQCGWQGTGRAFDIQNCEWVRCTGLLAVTNTTTAAAHVWLANLIDCRNAQFTGNQIFTISGSTNLTFFYVSGASTGGVEICDNDINHAASADQFLYIAATCPANSVEERANRFRGAGAWVVAKVVDASGVNISEQRVADIVAGAGVTASWDVRPNGHIVYTGVYTDTTDASGNITITLPTNLFRGIKSAFANTADLANTAPANVGTVTTTSMPIRYPGVVTASRTTSIMVIGV